MNSNDAIVRFAKKRSWFSVLDLQKNIFALGVTSAEVRLREERRSRPKHWEERWQKTNGKRFKQFRYVGPKRVA